MTSPTSPSSPNDGPIFSSTPISLQSTSSPTSLRIPSNFTNASTQRRNSIVLLYPHDYLDTTLESWTSGWRPHAFVFFSIFCPLLVLYVCVFSKFQKVTTGYWVM
ncbi:hypothetical protein HMI55_004855 [Coelomomyces lativittatus]|nr:hypothetical protein HMI55_004855 [Coelomomyces lativittatus]